ncbi:MAG: hypothetical protein LBE21_02745 [Pseudomonadales bacterium]|jgi:hypothetical protein|nr:hypothetical protein [Pseudomonadales bacterium]
MTEDLDKFISTFVKRERRDRYLSLLANAKRRSDGLWDLLHDTRHLDMKKFTPILNAVDPKAVVVDHFKRLGVKEAGYVLAARSELDGQRVALSVFLEQGGEDAAIFFPSVNAGYYANHEGEHYLFSAIA